MMKHALLVCCLTLGAAAPLRSQELERILLPVASSDLPGAYGSFWVTRFTVVNGLDRPLVQNEDAGRFGACLFPGCETPPPVPPNRAFEPLLDRPSRGWKPGVLI